MALISDNYMKALLKTVYENGVYNAKYQNSPLLNAIGKETFTGKEMKYSANYGNGGNFASDFSVLQSGVDASGNGYGARNLEWTMGQGYLTGMFDISQPEILTSAEERGAYMKVLSNKMASCFDGLSKTLAMYLYGGKYGIIDTVKDSSITLQATGNVMNITSAGAIKMDLGTRFVFVQADASGKLLPSNTPTSGIATVTAIDDTSITFDVTSALVGKVVSAGDYIALYGSSKNGIEGLADIIPSLDDRSGTNWATYIAEDFRGVDRSKAVDRLAGQFVKAESTGDTRLTDALVSLLKKTKRAGGLNNTIIINDETWDAVGAELGVQRNLWQATDGAPKSQGATAGFSALATAFGDAFIGRTVIDPYCTEGKAYSIEKDDLKFYDLGNVSRVISPVANDQMGKHDIESVGDQGFGDSFGSNVNVDKLFTVTQGTAGEFGPNFSIAAHIFGNFKIGKTASAGVAVLD